MWSNKHIVNAVECMSSRCFQSFCVCASVPTRVNMVSCVMLVRSEWVNESAGREVTSQARSTTVFHTQQRINNVCLLAKRGETLRQQEGVVLRLLWLEDSATMLDLHLQDSSVWHLLHVCMYVYISQDVRGLKISCGAHWVGESVD